MTEGLKSADFDVLHPASTYFLCVDLAASGIAVDDETFATRAVEVSLAAGGKGVDMVALAAEHTRLRHSVDGAIAAWEKAIAEQEALG